MGEVIGGVLGGIGSVGGALIQANAADKAIDASLTGYRYLTEGPGRAAVNGFLDYGSRGVADANAARAAQMELLGLAPSGTGAVDMTAPPGTGGSMAPNLGPGGRSGTNTFMRDSGVIDATRNPDGSWSVSGVSANPITATSAPATGGAMVPLSRPAAGVQPGSAGNAFNNYLNSTGYQFQLGQGQDAIASSAAARGLLNSGATAKALTKFGQNLASTTFNNYLSQLGGIGTAGQNAGTLGFNTLGLVSNAGTGAGSNAAGYIMDGGNAWAQGLAGGLGSLGNIITNLPPSQRAA